MAKNIDLQISDLQKAAMAAEAALLKRILEVTNPTRKNGQTVTPLLFNNFISGLFNQKRISKCTLTGDELSD